jgi:quercetin dioxygenase-like cupin family protein
MADARVLEPGAGDAVPNPLGGPITFKVRGAETNGALTAFENEIGAGEGPPLHVHTNEDELLYVLEGDVRFRFGDDIRSAPAGSSMFVPRGVPHCFQNVGAAPARMLIVFTPAGMEAFFPRLAEAVANGSDLPEAFRAAGEATGMSVVGPPLSQSHR